MSDEIEHKAVELAAAQSGVTLKAGHRTVLLVTGAKGNRKYTGGADVWDEDGSNDVDDSKDAAGAEGGAEAGAEGGGAEGGGEEAGAEAGGAEAGGAEAGGAEAGAEGSEAEAGAEGGEPEAGAAGGAEGAAAGEAAAGAEPGPDENGAVHFLALAVKAIGGTPLVNQLVRILDPDTGKAVGPEVSTDDAGMLRANVPAAKTYRLEIVEEAAQADELPAPPQHGDDEPAVLLCHFEDASGAPLANEKIAATSGPDKFELSTDEEGRLESPARLAPFELKLRGQTFTAHALPAADAAAGIYKFIVQGVAP